MSDRFEMRRVHTTSVPTEMVDFQITRYRSFGEFVRNAVSVEKLPARAIIQLAVSNDTVAGPLPTDFIGSTVYMTPETLGQWSWTRTCS